jgi:uncharacterized RDD family membrane protein YckC
MKCPKCGYLGFEPVNRCRNCGYDFSLSNAGDDPAPDLPIRIESSRVEPPADLSLATDRGSLEEKALAGSIRRAGNSVATAVASGRTVTDLPLFGSRIPGDEDGEDDEPLITKPSPPRPPLAVRRATPEVPRLRVEQARMQLFDLTLDTDRPPASSTVRLTDLTAPDWVEDDVDEPARDAAVSARFVAVMIDLLILSAIDAIVVYFTMQICGVTLAELGILPKGPLLAFLLVQNGGYLVAFTAGGQTLGKMAVDIRVVPADAHDTLDIGRACTRTALWLLLAIPAGLGFLTALLSQDRRGLHDRFAGTRVVRASA